MKLDQGFEVFLILSSDFSGHGEGMYSQNGASLPGNAKKAGGSHVV
ncbi:MAG: hypothetical protein AAGJ28_07730 [Pseudomonadota bacterium]